MQTITHHALSLAVFAFALSPLLRADPPAHPQKTSRSSADVTPLRRVTENLYAAYANEDVEGVLRLWSPKSPDLASCRKKMEELFAAHDSFEVKNLKVQNIKVDGDKANARAAVEISAVDTKSGKPAADLGKMQRALQFVRENGAWKIWRESPAEEELAAGLVSAKTKQQRAALLAKERELVTVKLRQALIAEGDQLKLKGDYPHAVTVYGIAQTVAERIGDKPGIVEALNSLGAVHYQTDQVLGMEYYQKALELGRSVDDKAGIAQALNNLGRSYIERGNFRLALDYIQKGLAIRETLGDKPGVARAINNIGMVHLEQGNYEIALEHVEKSSAMSQGLDHKVGIAGTQNNIGLIHRHSGNYEAALRHHLNSLTIRQQLGDKEGVAQALLNIAIVWRDQGNHDQALDYFYQALPLYEALRDKETIAITLSEAADSYLMKGDPARGLEHVNRAAELAQQMGASRTFFAARARAGTFHRALNRPEEARRAFDEAIAFVEDVRNQVAGAEQHRQRFFERRISPYHDSPYSEVVELLMSQDKANESLAYAERAKARVLLDVLQAGKVNVAKALTAEEQEQERKLQAEIASLNTQLNREKQREKSEEGKLAELAARLHKARLNYEAFGASLYAAHPELRSQRGEIRPLTVEEAGTLFPDASSALLEYVVTAEKTFLFVLTAGNDATHGKLKLDAYTLPISRKELAERVEQFRRQLAARDLGFRSQAHELFNLLLAPAREQLNGRTSLIIVPDEALWELPFQALASAEDRYLLEDAKVSFAPSLTALREMRNLRRKKTDSTSPPATLLAVGNPALHEPTLERVRFAGSDEKLKALPEAEQEVETLREIYGRARSKVFIGKEAREDRIKAEAPRYTTLHLATHAIPNNVLPMYSHVVLSQAEEGAVEDGLLEAWEIMKLDLNADLVVLSGCETGRGRVGAGEGMIGLAWALFVAGTPTTIVSQWKVESASTTELMVEFHRQLRSGNSGQPSRRAAAEALRDAALKQMRSDEYWHPFYWASFVVIGDGG